MEPKDISRPPQASYAPNLSRTTTQTSVATTRTTATTVKTVRTIKSRANEPLSPVDNFMRWQYKGRKNRKQEALVWAAATPLIPAYGLGLMIGCGATESLRSRVRPESLRKHAFSLASIVRTPRESEQIVKQLKELGVLRNHSRERTLANYAGLDAALERLTLDGKPVTQAQRDGVRAVITALRDETKRRADLRDEIATLTQSIKEQTKDFRQRFAGNSGAMLAEDVTYRKNTRKLTAAKHALASCPAPGTYD